MPSFDDPWIVAGQGTVGLEIAEDLAELGESAELVLVCCGGGGLSGGVAIGSGLPVVTVEPEGYDDVARSLTGGVIMAIENPGPTLCDALQTLVMCPLTFDILRDHGATGVAVSDAAAMRAVGFAFRELKLVLEPGGAVALAAALEGVVDLRGWSAVVVLSGANVGPEVFARCLA